MSEAVLVALCSFAATLVAGLSGYQLIAYRVEQLEKTVEKHGAAVSRTVLLEERLDDALRRLDALERAARPLPPAAPLSARPPSTLT